MYLVDLNYRGCTSCFACKLVGGKSHGRCAMRDELTPVLDAAHEADILVLGTSFISRKKRVSCAPLVSILFALESQTADVAVKEDNGFDLHDERLREMMPEYCKDKNVVYAVTN